MPNESSIIMPFGLLFQETVSPLIEQIHPCYDEETDLSYIMDETATLVPFVERNGILGTQTETKIRSESTDTDPGGDHSQIIGLMGTETITLVEAEDGDVDHAASASRFDLCKEVFIGTDTFTEVDAEPTDTD